MPAAYPLQSWLFAKLIQVFSFRDQELTDAANFWSLWFFVLSLGIAACYSAVGFATNRLGIVSNLRVFYFMRSSNNLALGNIIHLSNGILREHSQETCPIL